MSQSNHVTIPLLQNMPLQEKLHFLKNYFTGAFSVAKIFFPLLLASVFTYLRSLATMHFLGRLGSSTLAGCSLALASANISAYALFSGLIGGVETICSQAIGAKRYNLFRATIRRGMILLLRTSFPVFFLWLNIERILTLLKQNVKLASIAGTFLLYSVPDLVAQSLLHPLKAYLKTQSKTRPLLILTGVTCLLHCLIMYIFVSHFKFEVKGIAVSSVLSNFILVAFLFIYMKKELGSDNDEEEEVTEESYEDREREWKKLLYLALPSCGMGCLEFWFYEIMILICGLLEKPNIAIASMGLIIQITSLVYIFPHSLSSAISTRVGNELGSNRPQAARRAAIVGLSLSILLGIMASTFMFSVRNVWATFFTDDEDVIDLVSKVLPIVCLCELGNCPQTTVGGVLKGSARTWMGAWINTVAFYFVGSPVALALAFWFGFGLKGLWLGMLAAQITCVIGMMVAMYRIDWELEAERARDLTSVDDCRSDGEVEDGEAERLISRVESFEG
ncbi:protein DETOXIFICATION 50-like [Brassica napus]|nr:protein DETOXIFICATION 50-like [Brassica napus]